MKRSASSSNPFDPRVDRYIAEAATFAQPILTHIRELVHHASPEIEESIKWSRPFFVHRGVMLANMAAFTAHCGFGFWGPQMDAVLRADGIESSESSGSFGRLKTVKDLPGDKVLLGYLTQALALAEAAQAGPGSRSSRLSPKKRATKGDATAPPDLMTALEANPIAKENFATLSPSCRREYIEWIVDARRPVTRERRVAKTLQQVSEGKALHWKYV